MNEILSDPGAEPTPSGPNHVSGFVSLVGRPNAGKSTLLNAMVGAKLAIVADKPQTTRTIIQGVLTLPEAQIVFLDTPGIHEARNLLHKQMLEKIREALQGRDLILFLADASAAAYHLAGHQRRDAARLKKQPVPPPPEPGEASEPRSLHALPPKDEQAIQWLKDVATPVILVLNKIDALHKKTDLLPVMEQYAARYPWAEIIPVSALTKDGFEVLTKSILSRLPKGPRYFPEDYLTDQPERFLVAELVREKILHHTHEEVPHSVAVVVDTWADEPRKDGSTLTKILATIHVERQGQKAILIGGAGAMLKQVGAEARQDIETLLDRKVYLELFVRVTEDWRQRAQFLHELYQ